MSYAFVLNGNAGPPCPSGIQIIGGRPMTAIQRGAVRKNRESDSAAEAPVATSSLRPFSSDEFLTTLTSLPGVVLYQRVVTPDERIYYSYISEGARDLFGVSADEILSNPDALFSPHGSDYKSKFRE